MAKEYFKSKNIKYKEVNVQEDHKAAEEMIEKSGQMGVPVIEIDGKIIVGFNKPEIEKTLKGKNIQ
jgi:glutaredoxin-like YruB-family protein